jgi:vitamin B12 transporter
MITKKWYAIVITIVIGLNGFAQHKKDSIEQLDEIIITATKFEQTKQKTANVVYTISQQEIQRNQGRTVLDVLNTVVGVEIKGVNTNNSEPRSLLVRGGRSRQVLILIDGVPVSDPSLISQEFDLRFLALNQIEKIEILKGASSTLYGSGAATGVINIILKKNTNNKVTGSYEVTLGTNNEANHSSEFGAFKNQNANIKARFSKFQFNSSVNLLGTKGLSAAKSDSSTTFEDDPYQALNFYSSLKFNASKQFSIKSFLNYDEFSQEYDAGIFTDSNQNSGEQYQFRYGIQPRLSYRNGDVYVLASFQKLKRTDRNFSTFSNTLNTSIFEGESVFIDVVNRYKISKGLQIIAGFNFQEHNNNSVTPFGNIDRRIASFTTSDPYVSVNLETESGFIFNVGSRLNIHSNYGNHFVYDLSSTKSLVNKEGFKLRGIVTYSTAFIAPSTYQLFSDFGNTDLSPETSKTFEVGLEGELKNFNFNLVYFDRIENDAIIFASLNTPPYGRYENSISEISVNGLESVFNWNLNKALSFTGNYTYTNKETDADYIPKHKFTTQLNYEFSTAGQLSLVYRGVGERQASYYDSATFSTVSTTLASYQLFDVTTSYALLDNTVVFSAAITNVFDKDYQDVLGYATRGRNINLGLCLDF